MVFRCGSLEAWNSGSHAFLRLLIIILECYRHGSEELGHRTILRHEYTVQLSLHEGLVLVHVVLDGLLMQSFI